MALSSSNVTSGFVDLATYDELEKYMYGGADATAYFVRETRKATWFTQIPVCLNKSGGDPKFGQSWSVQVSRSGDYLLNLWLEAEFPFLQVSSGKKVRWVQNLMHNLVKHCSIKFNDLVAASFESEHLDFWAQFSHSACKADAYNAMIGNACYNNGSLENSTNPAISTGQSVGMNVASSGGQVLPGGALPAQVKHLHHPRLFLPLPFFFTRDSGLALPTAALPYNDMKIEFVFRDIDELLLSDDDSSKSTSVAVLGTDYQVLDKDSGSVSVGEEPALKNVHVWGNYAIVSNDERKRMACAPRDMLIEDVQIASRQGISREAINPHFPLRFSHAIKVLFFGLKNITGPDLSYYSTLQPILHGNTHLSMPKYSSNNLHCGQMDPIDKVSLIYENTARLEEVSSGFSSKVQPFYHGSSCGANHPGMHMYSYSLDFKSLDPLGSTNYGKLTNVNLITFLSRAARGVNSMSGDVNIGGLTVAQANEQQYEFVCSAIHNNVVRISGGALGFPVL